MKKFIELVVGLFAWPNLQVGPIPISPTGVCKAVGAFLERKPPSLDRLSEELQGRLRDAALSDEELARAQALFEDTHILKIDIPQAAKSTEDGNLAMPLLDQILGQIQFDGDSEGLKGKIRTYVHRIVTELLKDDEIRGQILGQLLLEIIQQQIREFRRLNQGFDKIEGAFHQFLHTKNIPQLDRKRVTSDHGDLFIALAYDSRATEFQGREKEYKELQAFLNDEASLCWWQIYGEGGQGKSRLALHLMDNLDESWYAGFIHTGRLAETEWASITLPDKMLIIVDYVAGPEKSENFIRALRELQGRGDLPGHKIRLLALERENYTLLAEKEGSGQSDFASTWLSHHTLRSEDQRLLLDSVFKKESALKLDDLVD